MTKASKYINQAGRLTKEDPHFYQNNERDRLNHTIERINSNIDDELQTLTADSNISQLIDEITTQQEDAIFDQSIAGLAVFDYKYALLQILKERLRYLKSEREEKTNA